MKLIDSHCHFDMVLAKDGNRQAHLDEMRRNQVVGFIQIGADPASMQYSWDLAHSEKEIIVWYTVGAHPGEAQEVDPAIGIAFARARAGEGDPKFVAIGEIGLDYYYHPEQAAAGSAQQRTFQKYLDLATELNMPVCIHTREAHRDTMAFLREHRTPILIHCFTGNRSQMEDFLALGAMISFSGIVTFKNAAGLREAALHCPVEKMLVETDAPFLAPVPFRGKLNRPGLVRSTLDFIADLKGMPAEELAAITFCNTVGFYRLQF